MAEPTPIWATIDTLIRYAPALNSLALAGIAWMISQFKTTNEHLATLNGRTGRIEVWAETHEKQNDERHTDNQRALHELKRGIGDQCRYPLCPAGDWDGRERRRMERRRRGEID